MNTVTTSFNTTVREMTEVSQQKMTEVSQRKKKQTVSTKSCLKLRMILWKKLYFYKK